MSENRKEIATVEEALEDIRAGKIIVLMRKNQQKKIPLTKS